MFDVLVSLGGYVRLHFVDDKKYFFGDILPSTRLFVKEGFCRASLFDLTKKRIYDIFFEALGVEPNVQIRGDSGG